MRADDAQGHDGTALVAADPYVAFAKIAALFDPPPPLQPGVHTSAVVDPGARIDPQAQVGPFACIGARSRIAAGVVVGPGCVIGDRKASCRERVCQYVSISVVAVSFKQKPPTTLIDRHTNITNQTQMHQVSPSITTAQPTQ